MRWFIHKAMQTFMGKLRFVVFLLVIMPATSFAHKGDHYILPKYGQMAIDLNNAENLVSAGIMYGYGLSKHLSFEAEFNSGIEGGRYSKRDAIGNLTESGEYQVQTLAGYAVLRKSLWNSGYLKGKLGLLYEIVERTTDQNQTLKDDSVGVAGGIGAGVFLFDSTTMELEATQIDRSITFYSLGVHIKF